MASPDGYVWTNGEVVTATKLNAASLPPLGPEDQQIELGQDATHSLVLKWTYDATAGNAFGVITTFGKSNDLYIQGKNIYFDTASLAFAVQMFTNGRVRVGGGNDDTVNAFQVNGAMSTVGSVLVGDATAADIYTKYETDSQEWWAGIGIGASGNDRWGVSNVTSSGSPLQLTPLNSAILGNGALATTATDGFLYVPTCAGTPTGTPTAMSGYVPIVVDTTNNKLYFHSNGAWRDAGP